MRRKIDKTLTSISLTRTILLHCHPERNNKNESQENIADDRHLVNGHKLLSCVTNIHIDYFDTCNKSITYQPLTLLLLKKKLKISYTYIKTSIFITV